jgi:hypothetical protein
MKAGHVCLLLCVGSIREPTLFSVPAARYDLLPLEEVPYPGVQHRHWFVTGVRFEIRQEADAGQV